MKTVFRMAALSAATLSLTGLAFTATAQEVTGAGASFPAPLYSKWASDYHKATGVILFYFSVVSGDVLCLI